MSDAKTRFFWKKFTHLFTHITPWILIGLFIRSAAQCSLQFLALSGLISQGHVKDFMNAHPVSVPEDLPIQGLVEDYLYNTIIGLFLWLKRVAWWGASAYRI